MTSLEKIEKFLHKEEGVPRNWKSLNKHKLDVCEWADALQEAEDRLDVLEKALREAINLFRDLDIDDADDDLLKPIADILTSEEE